MVPIKPAINGHLSNMPSAFNSSRLLRTPANGSDQPPEQKAAGSNPARGPHVMAWRTAPRPARPDEVRTAATAARGVIGGICGVGKGQLSAGLPVSYRHEAPPTGVNTPSRSVISLRPPGCRAGGRSVPAGGQPTNGLVIDVEICCSFRDSDVCAGRLWMTARVNGSAG